MENSYNSSVKSGEYDDIEIEEDKTHKNNLSVRQNKIFDEICKPIQIKVNSL